MKSDIKSLLFGPLHPGDEDDESDVTGPYKQPKKTKLVGRTQTLEDGQIIQHFHLEHERLVKDRYFGPWQARQKWADRYIDSPCERLYFNVLLQGPNTLDFHLSIAQFGVELVGVVLIRPWVQYKCDSMLVMEAGIETMVATLGGATVTVSKESRGIIHIGVEFWHGLVKVNPDNIGFVPYAFPNEFVGGKTMEFLTDPKEFSLPPPNKPSFIGMLTSVDERKYGTPIHLLNMNLLEAPDKDPTAWERKWSSFDYFRFRFGPYGAEKVDSMHAKRVHYKKAINASLVAHRCCITYTNPLTMKKEDQEGTGPGCSFRMNMPGAQKVANGLGLHYPQRIERYAYQL